ncbi:hypothetical protein [Actinomadura sp. WMMA1423]|uniref:hypothetical protein n=1 Tax=Actinomadura sp. WMMA1423 TaxID=2591108 RepID=UPI0011474479|nr:hypothetical protein [Actinomadura sp. WMMA1423]
MADDHAESKRWDDLTDQMVTIYGIIRTVLAHLPLPIGLVHWDREWEKEDSVRAIFALNRARMELLDAQPIEQRHKDLLQKAIVDWLLGFDLIAIIAAAGDPGSWRMDGLEHLIRRAELAAGQVALDLDLGED